MKWKDVETTFRGDMIHIQREMTEHIDDQTGKKKGFEIVDHCKTPAGDRRLLLNDQALSVLKQIKAYNEHNSISTDLDDLIFVRTIKGKHLPCTPRSFDPRLRRYCRMSGMIVIKSPHDIRRTVLTNLYMAGMPLKKIQQFAGHSSLRQTMDYLRISDDDMDMMPYINSLSECTGVPVNIAAFRHEA